MKIQNYTQRLFNNQLVIRTLTMCKTKIGDMRQLLKAVVRECKNIGVSIRDFLPRLIQCHKQCNIPSNNKPSDLSHGSQSNSFIPYREVHNMNKFITMLLGFVLFLTMAYSFTTMFSSLGLAPILGITLRRKKPNNTKTLPQAYNGLGDSDMNKKDFITERVDQVNKDKVINDQVSRVTNQAEEQWNIDHPDFEKIQTNIIDNNYCDLVAVYNRAGLSIPDAFTNSLIAIVREYGSPISNDIYSIDKTMGEFNDYINDVHCFNCYDSRSGQVLDAILKLKNEYGVVFNKPIVTTPSSENLIDMLLLDDINDDEDEDILELDDEDIELIDSDISIEMGDKAGSEPNSPLSTPILKSTTDINTDTDHCGDTDCGQCNQTTDDDEGLGSMFG